MPTIQFVAAAAAVIERIRFTYFLCGKSVLSTPVMTDQGEKLRYLLRSMTEENKKPPLPPVDVEKSVGGSTDRKTAAQRLRKI